MGSLKHGEGRVPLPTEVREEDTAFTTVYEHGKLVYDGAAARAGDEGAKARREAASGEVPTSLNEMLKWGIQNSSPDELAKMKESGARPTQIDKEIMDMLLGEPIVAKMRECLAKLPQEAGAEPPVGVDAALGAMEELEYYVEDIDNANDMAKIGGLQILLTALLDAAADPELREAACGALAASLQNNPKVQQAALALDVLPSLVRTLRDAADDAEALPLLRKALLATSAMLRSSAGALEALLVMTDGVATLVSCGAHADAKLRRRALFLLLALCRDAPAFTAALLPTAHVAPTLLDGACDADEDTRESALQMLALLSDVESAARLRDELRALDAPRRLSAALANKGFVGEGEGNPEHAGHYRLLLAWLSGAD